MRMQGMVTSKWVVMVVPGQKPTELLMKHTLVNISFEPRVNGFIFSCK
jgi:hypothetical protein